MFDNVSFYGIGHNISEVENLTFNWLIPDHYVFMYYENPCVIKGEISKEHACIIFGIGDTRDYATKKNFVNSYVGFRLPEDVFASFGVKRNIVFYPRNFEEINSVIKEIADENRSRRKNYLPRMYSLLINLLTAASRGTENPEEAFDKRLIIMENIRKRYLADLASPTDINALISKTPFSRTVFYELYQKFFHDSPKNDLIWARLHRSKELMANTDMKIYEIAAACGFENIGHFSRTFSKRFGYTPKNYSMAVRKRK